jgi:hypothetical protein
MDLFANRNVRDFGGKAAPTRRGVHAMYSATAGGRAEESLEAWRAYFRKTCGQDWPRPKARLDRLARLYGVPHDPARPEIVLFAVHTWYVLLVKLLAGHALAAVRGRDSPAVTASGGDACASIGRLMQGGVFAELAATDPWPGGPFDWFVGAWSNDLDQAAREAAGRIASYDPAEIIACAAGGGDLLKPLYEALFPRTVRHALGEYYTPSWLAEHVLDQAGYFGQPDARLLDPTCGSGTFLLAALRRWRNNVVTTFRRDEHASRRSVMSTLPIAGFDLHPLAVASARANYLLAIADLIAADENIEVPVCARDAILDLSPEPPCFDFVVGNPPWVAWDNLPGEYREATKPHWQRYGLFSLSGSDARHGGGKKDLSMLVLYACADRYLRDRGRLGMVITQTLFQSKGAGDGFRRFQIGEGPPLSVLRVDDMVDVRPFDAANWTSVVVLQKGSPTTYPVPYVKWKPSGTAAPLPAAVRVDLLARPIDADRPTSPWTVGPAERRMELRVRPGFHAEYTAHLGANSGGANAVYWLEVQGRTERGVRVRNRAGKAKRVVESAEAEIEPDLVYPLVRWADVARWSARPSGYLLLAQDPATRTGIDEERMLRDYPRTLAYLRRFHQVLSVRAAYRRYQGRQPFYSMYNVGPYTLAAAKVIWRRMDRAIRAAVVETVDDPHLGPRPVVPQETCVLIACNSGDEAHYLCALLNSARVNEIVSAHSVAGGKGFGTPSILDYLPLEKFNPADVRHTELAATSRRLHDITAAGSPLGSEREAIDRLAVELLKPRGGF